MFSDGWLSAKNLSGAAGVPCNRTAGFPHSGKRTVPVALRSLCPGRTFPAPVPVCLVMPARGASGRAVFDGRRSEMSVFRAENADLFSADLQKGAHPRQNVRRRPAALQGKVLPADGCYRAFPESSRRISAFMASWSGWGRPMMSTLRKPRTMVEVASSSSRPRAMRYSISS